MQTHQDEVGSSESGSPTSISAKANSMMVRTVAMDVLIHFERRTPSQPGPAGPMGSPQVHGPQGRAHTHTQTMPERTDARPHGVRGHLLTQQMPPQDEAVFSP